MTALVNGMVVLHVQDSIPATEKVWEHLSSRTQGLADLTYLVQGLKKLVREGDAPRF